MEAVVGFFRLFVHPSVTDKLRHISRWLPQCVVKDGALNIIGAAVS